MSLEPTIAKEALPNASKLSDTTGTFRGEGETLFALKTGHVVTHVDDHLFNLKATVIDNKLDINATRIEKEMTGSISIDAGDTVLVAEGNNIVAIGFGQTHITVGNNNYRVTVNTDGTMQTELLVADTIDVREALGNITAVTDPANADITPNGTTLTIKPVAEVTEIVEVTDGAGTIQVSITVTKNGDEVNVSSHIISNSYDVGVIGFYPTGIETANTTTYSSNQGGLIIGTDGVITYYPGKAGTSHVLVQGTSKHDRC